MVNERPYTYYLAEQAYDENGKPLEGQYIQKDGTVGTTEYRKATGKSALPTHYIGLNTRLSYKNWDFAISGHGSFGHYIYNYVKADQYVQSVYSDQGNFSNILESTRETGFETQQLYSDIWLEKGDFFRIDNITLGYTFDKLWDSTSSLRLTLGVSNVFTFTGYDGLDPDLSYGIDREVYPRPRTYTFGLNLKF
jgi:iron complex outermembrane receptor protein